MHHRVRFHCPRNRRSSIGALIIAAAIAPLSTRALGAGSTTNVPTMGLTGLTTLMPNGHLTFNPNASANPGRTFSMLPLNAPPINGFQPQVVYGLTDEQDRDDELFASRPSSNPGGAYPGAATLPVFGTPKYFVATFDTGSQAHLITYDNALAFDIDGANRTGNYQAQIQGVNGVEDAEITDAMGIYSTGFANAGVSGSNITVTPGTLRGQWQTSILTSEQGSALPNLIGSPMVAQYQTVIRNSQTRHLTVGATTYRSPNVAFQSIGTAAPAGYSKLTLNVQSANGVSPDPVYFPSFDNFNNFGDNPTTPSFWGNLTATATATHTQGSSGAQDFLFDTGAQVSVVSEDTAASVGFYTGGENPTPPDFFVDVSGVGGTTVEVPGFYMDSLRVTTNGGPISWTHVPVLVLNIPDPRDGIGFIPGILGMNLFTDRDLVINGGLSDPWLAIGPQITSQWSATGGGTWGDDTKWSLGSPDNADVPANFLGSITSPSTITVDASGFTVGSMKFDNANRYTIAGPGTITISAQSTSIGAIQVVSGSHTISAPMQITSNTTIDVQPSTSTLTMSGSSINAGTVALTKIGAGAVVMTHVRAGSLSVNAGTVAVATNGTNASASRVNALTIAGGATPTATLDLNDNDILIANGTYAAVRDSIAFARHGGAWDRPGLTSSVARTATPKNKTLGTVTGAQYLSTGNNSFDGFAVSSGNMLVKFTYYGDADLNGIVNFDDYSRIDGGFNSSGTDWFHGDFDYNSVVNFDDYALIDAAFNTQGATQLRAMAYLDGNDRSTRGMNTPALQLVMDHFTQFGVPYAASFLNAVPEPASVGVLSLALLTLQRRRRMP
jgi:hypothetical protein